MSASNIVRDTAQARSYSLATVVKVTSPKPDRSPVDFVIRDYWNPINDVRHVTNPRVP